LKHILLNPLTAVESFKGRIYKRIETTTLMKELIGRTRFKMQNLQKN